VGSVFFIRPRAIAGGGAPPPAGAFRAVIEDPRAARRLR
jgi:hypothetical protein